jgi:hypothetical protein
MSQISSLSWSARLPSLSPRRVAPEDPQPPRIVDGSKASPAALAGLLILDDSEPHITDPQITQPQITKVTSWLLDHGKLQPFGEKMVVMKFELLSLLLRLDCLSCVLTVFSTILVGRRCWEGWVLAAANSVIICVIGLRTSQLGFIPANLFCIVLYAVNLRTWRKAEVSPAA